MGRPSGQLGLFISLPYLDIARRDEWPRFYEHPALSSPNRLHQASTPCNTAELPFSTGSVPADGTRGGALHLPALPDFGTARSRPGRAFLRGVYCFGISSFRIA